MLIAIATRTDNGMHPFSNAQNALLRGTTIKTQKRKPLTRVKMQKVEQVEVWHDQGGLQTKLLMSDDCL